MSAVPENGVGAIPADIDSQETREWMDALSAVIEKEGPERAHYLLEQLLLGQTAFKVSAGVNARRHVPLNINTVAAVVFVFGVPKVVEARTKHVGQ